MYVIHILQYLTKFDQVQLTIIFKSIVMKLVNNKLVQQTSVTR